ncbi:MAG: radical SAM family heme chaperone HemW [Oscillospiraceae bacterium]|nr:radical SAM family heme chaperone HemW [Oscillospiraceae bacterium]
MDQELKKLGIYIHIPFCKSKCEYCDFYSLPGAKDKKVTEDYLQAVMLHIREAAVRATGYEVDTVYFGGGTPSFFGDEGLRRLLGEIDRRVSLRRDAEITLEANPDSVSTAALRRLRRAGFNRISIGVQSDRDEQLKALGRPHTFQQARDAVAAARDAGFENLSLDLMYGLPGQSRDQWAGTLQQIIAMRPEHISCYGLRVEEGTPLYEYKDCVNLPDDDAQADMYLYAVDTLESYGYRQYEISNFAREGFESRHNLKYWLGGEYLGFGPAAASDFAGKRYTFQRDLRAYVEGMFSGAPVLSECETIPLRERAGEYLMLRLRTSYGIEAAEYYRMFRMDFSPLEELLQRLAKAGYARQDDGRWRLTPAGFLLSNQIILRLQEAQRETVQAGRE